MRACLQATFTLHSARTQFKMASNLFSMARNLAISQVFIGILLICFGIADRVVDYGWTGPVGFGIWIGIWVCLTGAIGIDGTRRGRFVSRETLLRQNGRVFMSFSVTSAVFAGIIILCYVPSILIYQNGYFGYTYHYDENGREYKINRRYSGYEEQMAISAVLLALGFIEFFVGVWSAICCCLIKCCAASLPQQEQEVVYSVNSEMTSAAGSVVMITGNPPKLVEMPPPHENAIQNTDV